jgi:hypothetical protein
VVSQWCYSGVTVVLQWCYNGVTMVLQWCYNGVTMVQKGPLCSRSAVGASHPGFCHPSVTQVLQKGIQVFHKCSTTTSVTQVLHKCYKNLRRVLKKLSGEYPTKA